METGANAMMRKGYNGTGVQEIVDGAGVPKGSFYNYFKSKEDFVVSAMEQASGDSIRNFELALAEDHRSARERILGTYRELVDGIEASRDYTKGCFVGNMCQELADTHVAIAEKAEVLFRRYTAPLARCLRQAQSQGDIRPGADPDQLAEAIFNSWEGAVLRMKSSRNSNPLNAFLDMLASLLS